MQNQQYYQNPQQQYPQPQYPQQQQPKKTNWGMIILILILVPLLILGSIFAYRMMTKDDASSGNTAQTVAGSGFPIVGVWYRNEPGVNAKYIFDPPATIDGKQQGKVDIVTDDLSGGKVHYEIIGEGKLRISDPQGQFSPWELSYIYNPSGQTVEIKASGHSATYSRNPPQGIANNNSNNNININNATPLTNPAKTLGTGNINNAKPPAGNSKITDVNNIASEWKNAYIYLDSSANVSVTVNQTRIFYDLIIQNGNLIGGKFLRTNKPLTAGYMGGKEYYTFMMVNDNTYDWKVEKSVNEDGSQGSLSGMTGRSKLLLMADGSLIIHREGEAPINDNIWTRVR